MGDNRGHAGSARGADQPQASTSRAAAETNRQPQQADSTGDRDRVPHHPYAKVADATNAGDRDRASGGGDQQNKARDPPHPVRRAPDEPARNLAPVEDPRADERIFRRGFAEERSISVTPIELLAISPAIRKLMHDATSVHCI